jgi:lipopolysaccharide transport system ATP-binding protein
MSTVISVENLSKVYRLGQIGTGTISRDLNVWWAKARGKPNPLLKIGEADQGNRTGESIWALKNVSFTVEQGEVLGIIGRNGAGKSTLLKILSSVTAPTGGRVKMNGRIASLLEVGTGFHPELTGRENIYLNGAILGMSRKEIDRKFDEIVDFAEIGKFITTPVKRYSSGMYVRLAFAVAAHLEPEILLVDEVLAVGDHVFQDKCLRKMHDVSHQDRRTVLFVSHNMNAIQTICQRGLLLDRGMISRSGSVKDVVDDYLNQRQSDADSSLEDRERSGTGQARIYHLELLDENLNEKNVFSMSGQLNIRFRVKFFSPSLNPTVGVNILTEQGVLIADCRSSHYGCKFGKMDDFHEFKMRIEKIMLYPGRYIVEPWIADTGVLSEYDWIKNAGKFTVISNPELLSGAIVDSEHGISYIPTEWEENSTEER